MNPVRYFDKISHTNEEKSFFCSELIASCYKSIGLLPTNVASAQYWPGTFAAKGKLQLSDNARLLDEQLVDFTIVD